MKEFKEEHIDPEQYWPEAAALLENHYKAKRRRRAIVLFGVVLVGLLSVYFLQTEKVNFTEKKKSSKKDVVNENSVQSNAVLPNKNVNIQSAEETADFQEENLKSNHPSLVSNDEKLANSSLEYSIGTKLEKQKKKQKEERRQKISKVKEMSVVENIFNTNQSTATPSKQIASSTNKSDTKFTDEINRTTDVFSIDFIPSMPLLKWMCPAPEVTTIQLDNRPELLTKKKAKWDLLVYGGVNDVQKELSGKSSSSYLLRREKEEAPALLPFGGLQLSKSINNWDFRGGVEFAVVGEQVKYSPYAKGDYLNVYDDWLPNNYIVTDTDSAYIWGMLFLNTTDYTVMDSIKITKTDTLNGIYYNSNIRNANGTNRWYVMELPLEVLYQFRMKRWGIGLSAGIAPGLVVQSSGYYLKEDESGYASIQKYNKQQFTLSARAGLEFSYLLNTRCRILLRPTSQYSLLKMDAGANEKQRYQRNGISLGILYMIP